MPEEIKNPSNKVERSYEGKYYAFWRGHIVYEHQKLGSGVLKRNAPLRNILPSAMPEANSPEEASMVVCGVGRCPICTLGGPEFTL